MSRIVQVDSPAKQRAAAIKWLKLVLREAQVNAINIAVNKDRLSFIVICLAEIQKSVGTTIAAWEKRDYWLKADQFRLEWAWVDPIEGELRLAVQTGHTQKVGELIKLLSKKLSNFPEPKRIPKQQPWIGAAARISNQRR